MADNAGDATALDMGAVADALPSADGNMNTEAAALAREKGWVEPQRYNYDAYNTVEKPADVAEVASGEWGSNAAKYEWKEEYGDIGPPNEELEKMLFHGEHLVRQGNFMEKYVLALTLLSLLVLD